MSTKSDYDAKIDVIRAVPTDQVKVPSSIPVDEYVQEAENLFKWCQPDKEMLTHKGLSWDIVDDLPLRSGALREAETVWNAHRFGRKEAEKQWLEKSDLAYELRNEVLHEFRYAYRNDAELSARIKAISDGNGHADMIQDLNDLSKMGRDNPDPLIAINFDMTLLDGISELMDELAPLLAEATRDRTGYKESKVIRDQAYTYLKEAVDEVCACGQHVFWRDEDRKKGYRSKYLRRQRSKSESPEKSENDS
jgi:hypothetical protein